jgi:hypothetical protein
VLAAEGDIDAEGAEEGEEEEEEFVPIVGVHIDLYGRPVQKHRNPYTGQYMGRPAREERGSYQRNNAYVRTGGYEGRPERDARDAYEVRPAYVPEQSQNLDDANARQIGSSNEMNVFSDPVNEDKFDMNQYWDGINGYFEGDQANPGLPNYDDIHGGVNYSQGMPETPDME